MPRIRTAETERLTLPSSVADDEAWVEMKTRATHGDVSKARRAVLKITPADLAQMANGQRGPGDPHGDLGKAIDPSAYPNALIAQLVVAWNFTDEGGEPLKITEKSIELLDARDVEFLWRRARAMTEGRPPLGNGNSEKPSQKPSSARLDT